MNYVWLALIGGAAAFPPCLGMCGGFALHLSGGGRADVLGRQFLSPSTWRAERAAGPCWSGSCSGTRAA